MTDNWPEILRDAATLIEDKWQDESDTEKGYCLLEAIAHTWDNSRWWSEVPEWVCGIINQYLYEVCPTCRDGDINAEDEMDVCYIHNDHHCSGGQEAAQILQKAAALMEEDVNLPY